MKFITPVIENLRNLSKEIVNDNVKSIKALRSEEFYTFMSNTRFIT